MGNNNTRKETEHVNATSTSQTDTQDNQLVEENIIDQNDANTMHDHEEPETIHTETNTIAFDKQSKADTNKKVDAMLEGFYKEHDDMDSSMSDDQARVLEKDQISEKKLDNSINDETVKADNHKNASEHIETEGTIVLADDENEESIENDIKLDDTATFINAKHKKSRRRKIFDCILIIFLALTFTGTISGFAILYNIVDKVSAEGLAEKMVSKDSSIFYAADGKTVIGELGGESRENISYAQVPQSTIDAFLAIEDSRFYQHNGFDLPRFLSSALNNLKSGSLAQGGSTLTMQTIDNFVMKPQEDEMQVKGQSFNKLQKIERKIQEIWLSMQIEKDLTKEEIMTKYLNQINFGQHTRGIQKGAQYYFGKNVEDLNLAESAFLAGVINAPNAYNPYRGVKDGVNFYKYATQRRDETLYQMLNHGYISETEYKLAKATKLAFLINGEPDPSTTDPYKDYVRAAADEMIRKYNIDPATTPMIIYTALDINAQKEANNVSAGKVVDLNYNKYFQIGFSVINNKNGEISAVSAGRTDITSASPTQRFRFSEPHQPGSSVKPILDYAPAFDKLGYCTSRVYVDKPLEIGGWKVVNSDRKHYGKISMERAIAQSLNTPAVETFDTLLKTVGNDEMINYNKALGFSDATSDKVNIQYAIGASFMQASTTQMAAAYSTLANGGTYVEPHMVRAFTHKDTNKTVNASVKQQQAMSPQAAFMTSELLDKAIFGEYKGWNLMSKLGFGAYPVYGKTGTSDWGDDADKYGGAMKDEWMINYTSEYTIATWTGFDGGVVGGNTFINEELLYRNIPGKINKHMLDALVTGKEQRIQNPGGVSSYGGGLIKTDWLKDAAKNNPLTVENSKTDNKNLKQILDEVKKLHASDFTAETFKKLQEAIKAAEKVIKDDLAPQKDIDSALKAILEAQHELLSTADKSSLENAIHNASTIYASSYTSESYARLQTAIEKATAILAEKTVTQKEINDQINAINQAINDLVSINKDTLYAVIIGARSIDRYSYTADSYTRFMNIVDRAVSVYNNPYATQSEINAQVRAIMNAQTTVLRPR